MTADGASMSKASALSETIADEKLFLWHTWTDQSVPVENSLLLLQALRKAGVNVEAHLYPMGPHGIALGTEETQGIDQKYLAPYCESWMGLAIRWISEQL